MPQIFLPIYLLFLGSFFILIITFSFIFKKQNITRTIFLIVGFLQFLWAFGVLITQQFYFLELSNDKLSLLTQLISLSIFLIPVLLYNFSINFCRSYGQKILLILTYLFSFSLLILMGGNTLKPGLFGWFDANMLYWFYSGFIIFIIFIFFLTLHNFNKICFSNQESQVKRREALLFITLSFGIYGLIFLYFLPATFIDIFPFLFLILPVYGLILGHFIMEKNSKITILTTNTIIIAVLILLASLLVFPGIELNLILRSSIFVLISFISFLLLKYMNRIYNQNIEFEYIMEVRTKELQEKTWRLDEVNERLEESNTVLEIMVRARTKELKELNENLEIKIQQRTKELQEKTKELQEKVDELKNFSNIFIDREAKMVELKEKIQELENRLKEK